MYKRGYTLIEVVVAMGIFLTVATLAIGAFVTIVRMRALTTNMRDSQQKLRVASEKIVRLAREANKVRTDTVTNGKKLEMFFLKNDGSGYHVIYKIRENTPGSGTYNLFEKECFWRAGVTSPCPWGAAITDFDAYAGASEVDMLGGSIKLDDSNSSFEKQATVFQKKLLIKLSGQIDGLAPYYEDSFVIAPWVILEGLK